MPKRPFIRKQKKKRHGANFWDHEYQNPAHLALSTAPSEDFLKFIRFLERHQPHLLAPDGAVLDLGCGNGRHLVPLATTHQMPVYGIDISTAAIKQAREVLPPSAQLFVRSLADPLPAPDQSCHLVLDLMSSHFLLARGREKLRQEISRVLRPGGFLLLKTFLLDDDLHSRRLLAEHPGPEPGTYIHPTIGVPEYVTDEETLLQTLAPSFTVERVYRSHKHRFRGRARKRRTITIYARMN